MLIFSHPYQEAAALQGECLRIANNALRYASEKKNSRDLEIPFLWSTVLEHWETDLAQNNSAGKCLVL